MASTLEKFIKYFHPRVNWLKKVDLQEYDETRHKDVFGPSKNWCFAVKDTCLLNSKANLIQSDDEANVLLTAKFEIENRYCLFF